MKATGIVRRIDDLGRVVIPKEIRRTMRIREGDPLEIYKMCIRDSCKSFFLPQESYCTGIRLYPRNVYSRVQKLFSGQQTVTLA